MGELLKIPSCMREKSSQLRYIYDKISIHVRGLESLGVTAEQYGSMLIPVVTSKLLTKIRVQIARLTSPEVWSIREMLELIRNEVEAREASEHVKLNNQKKTAQSYSSNTSRIEIETQIETFHQNQVLRQHYFLDQVIDHQICAAFIVKTHIIQLLVTR